LKNSKILENENKASREHPVKQGSEELQLQVKEKGKIDYNCPILSCSAAWT
jgi:hypothetical protein